MPSLVPWRFLFGVQDSGNELVACQTFLTSSARWRENTWILGLDWCSFRVKQTQRQHKGIGLSYKGLRRLKQTKRFSNSLQPHAAKNKITSVPVIWQQTNFPIFPLQTCHPSLINNFKLYLLVFNGSEQTNGKHNTENLQRQVRRNCQWSEQYQIFLPPYWICGNIILNRFGYYNCVIIVNC